LGGLLPVWGVGEGEGDVYPARVQVSHDLRRGGMVSRGVGVDECGQERHGLGCAVAIGGR